MLAPMQPTSDESEVAVAAPPLRPEPPHQEEPGEPGEGEQGAADPAPGAAEGPAGEQSDVRTDGQLLRAVCALVFASPDPLGIGRLAELLGGARPARVREALEEVGRRLERAGLPLELRQIAGGWRFLTAPDVGDTVAGLVKARKAERLSPAGLETLAVIAYRQPVTKAEIEAIRGVQCGPMLRGLVDRGLARVTGRSEQPGHPLQYGTTREFLDRFGLAGLDDLPRDGELLRE